MIIGGDGPFRDVFPVVCVENQTTHTGGNVYNNSLQNLKGTWHVVNAARTMGSMKYTQACLL